eukprot:5455287-Pyramimonas_sp.AAC.1
MFCFLQGASPRRPLPPGTTRAHAPAVRRSSNGRRAGRALRLAPWGGGQRRLCRHYASRGGLRQPAPAGGKAPLLTPSRPSLDLL